MEVIAYWEGGYRIRMPVRQFELLSDEPPEYGGEDSGPAPTELLLASTASCFAMAVAYIARRSGARLQDLAVRVQGSYEGRRFQRIRVEVISSHSREDLERFVEQARDYCYVSNTLRQAPILEFAVGEETLTHAPAPAPE